MQKIVIATRNFGKYKELMEVLKDLPFKFVSLNDEKFEGEAEENANTYEGNAILKAEYVGHRLNLPVIADDSGIHVDALKDELGVHTRRWGAGEKASDEEWLAYFLNKMGTKKNKNVKFISVIALYRPNHETITFRGDCNGTLLQEPQVALDPGIPLSAVFLPGGKNKVFSAMSKDEKNEISHRGKAIKSCADFILKNMM